MRILDEGLACTMAYKKLFSEIKFGRLNLKNRIIFAPVSTNLADAGGNVTPELAYHYRRRAQGGASLITLENMCIIYPDARSGATQPRVDSDDFIPGLSRISNDIHLFGSYASMELTHPGIFSETEISGRHPIGPSSLDLRSDGMIPRELDEKGIGEIVEGFAGAASRAKAAGYDGVEIEAAHGLLVNQFLSPYTNKRNDKFGGSTENRLRMAEMIIRRINDLCGRSFPVSARLPVMDNVQGGITADEGVKIARGFEELGYCALHADFGLGDKERRLEPMQYAEGWRTFLAKALKDGDVKVPVIAVGVIRNPSYASEILESNAADVIALGRGLIADPDWPRKALAGNEGEIKRCIGCSECIKARHDEGTSIRCGVNPTVGRNECDEILPVARRAKKILVVGAGISGLEAAMVSKMRGYDVEIWERGERMGGALLAASSPPGKEKLFWLLEYYDHMLRKLGIEIKFNREATPDDIRGSGFDAVIVAAGSRCYMPATDRRNDIISAKKVLERKLEFKGSRIVVGGGGLVGCETALYLAAQGNDVTIVEMLPQLALDMESLSRGHLLKELKRYNVKMITGKGIKQIHERHITLEGGDEIPMDYFIVAFGGYSDRSLYGELKEDYETYLVGDASRAGKIVDAVSSGYFTGRMI